MPEGDAFQGSSEYGERPGVRISELNDEIVLEGVVPADKPEEGGYAESYAELGTPPAPLLPLKVTSTRGRPRSFAGSSLFGGGNV